MQTKAVLGGAVAAMGAMAIALALLTDAFDANPDPPAVAKGGPRDGGSDGYVAPYLVLDVDLPLGESIYATAYLLSIDLGETLNVGRPRAGAPVIRVSSHEPPDARGQSAVDYWGAFVSLSGEIEAWEPASREPLLLPIERSEALTAMLGPAVDGAHVRWLTAHQIVEHLASGGEGVAILPAGSATPRIRSVPAGGVDLVRGTGDPEASPLVQRVWWSWDGDRLSALVEKLRARVNVPPPLPVAW